MKRFAKAVVNATVNALIVRINAVFGLKLPLLPLNGWPQFMQNLWRMLISGQLPDPGDPLPWVIPVQGHLEGLLPEGSTAEVKVHILVGTSTYGSPDIHP